MRGDGSDGYISLDDFVFNFNELPALCGVFPPTAAINPTTDGSTPQTTSSIKPNFQNCEFEKDTCEYSSPSETKWIRTNNEELSNANKPGPGGIDKGYYAYVSADQAVSNSSVILESTIHDETIATCMHFFYNIQVCSYLDTFCAIKKCTRNKFNSII